jgi:hypothetical protein
MNAPILDPLDEGDAAQLQPLLAEHLAAVAGPPKDWIWHGYLRRGGVTLLTSQWKAGKTTLLALLLDRLGCGGQLAGLAVQAGRAAVVSEEDAAIWFNRSQQLDFGRHVSFFCRPFVNKPQPAQWNGLINRLLRLWAEEGIDLVVLDSLSALLPAGAESHADLMNAALRPLERLTAAGLAVVLVHHPRKGITQPGQSARGSGALSSYVDVLIELRASPRSRETGRRRRLSAWSRHKETPEELSIELSEDGRDYLPCPAALEEDQQSLWETVESVLSNPPRQLTRAQLLDSWPDRRRPSDSTLWRLLRHQAELGLVCQTGDGHRGTPLRYHLPAYPDAPIPFDPFEQLSSALTRPHITDDDLLSSLRRAADAE